MSIESLALPRVNKNRTCNISHLTPQQVTNEDREFLEVNDKIAQVNKIVHAIILSHANLSMFHTTLILLIPQKESETMICFTVVVM
jgi:hypothetical protein